MAKTANTVLNAQTNTESNEHKKLVLQSGDVMQQLGISRATLWRWVREGIFPKPVKIGNRLNVWKPEQLTDFVEKLGAV